MHKFKFLFIFLLATLFANAHGIDISTMLLVEQDNGKYSLQIRSSLDAYRKEVKLHFADTPYDTPEEFQNQLIEHFQQHLKITVNGNQEIELGQPIVQLGHETVVYYDHINLPTNYNTIQVDGGVFKDVNLSKVKLLILKKGVEKKPIILNQKNNYIVDLALEEDQFVINTKKAQAFPYQLPLWVGTILICAFLILKFRNKKKATSDLPI